MDSRQVKRTAGCLFSGMGGFASGLVAAGFEISWAIDNDASARETFRHRFPLAEFLDKDIQDFSIEEEDLSAVDVIAAGFPCQSFSQAGERRGLDDPRGRLFFEIPRLLKELKPERRPPLIIMENVPFLLRGGGRSWFDCIQREIRKAGYWFREASCWTVNVKDATNLPQDRERLFMVAASREHFSYNPFTSLSIPGDDHGCRHLIDEFIDRTRPGEPDSYLSSDNRYFKMIDREMANGESDKNIYQLRRSYVREKKGSLCPTLTANMGNGGHNVPFVRDSWGIRRLSVDEVARLQGFETKAELFPAIQNSEKYRLLGNAVCVHLAHLVGKKCIDILDGLAE